MSLRRPCIEWPKLARETATLSFTPPALPKALRYTLGLIPKTDGQKIPQREIATAIENALDARRQRILISRSEVNPVKWVCLLLQAACALVVIAMMHSNNRVTSGITTPFVGEVSVGAGAAVTGHACFREVSEQRDGFRLASWSDPTGSKQ